MKMMIRTLFLAAALAAGARPAGAQTQGNLGPLPPALPGGVTSNLTTGAVLLHATQGLGLLFDFAMTSAATNGTVVLTFQVSPDSNTWSTVGGPVLTFTGAGTARVTGYTNVPTTALANMTYLRPYTLWNNGTNTLFPTNLFWSVTDPSAR